MEIKIQARNLEITPRAESYIQKKFSRLERHLSQISDAKIEVYRSSAKSQGKSVVAQMTLSTGKYTPRGQDTGVNLFAADEAKEELGRLVRTKRFSMTPMSIEDAILQMGLLDHSFFLFFNTDTEEYAVAYRRNDGGYGVIEPETA